MRILPALMLTALMARADMASADMARADDGPVLEIVTFRPGFRSFRVDRITRLVLTGEAVPDEPGRRLQDWQGLHTGPVVGDG